VVSVLDANKPSLKSASLFRRELLFGLGACGLIGLATSCASQQGTGSALKNSVVATPPSSASLVEAIKRVEKAGQILIASTQSPVNWKFGAVSGLALIATFLADNGIMMSETLIERCENEGQIAAILAQRMALVMLPARSGVVHNFSQALDLAPTTLGLAEVTSQADSAAILALARAGYDPRDALVIWQRIGRTNGDGTLPHATRLAAMGSDLRKMGYQI
jgi:hypothetical protein